MTSPITWSLSASVLVSDAVCAQQAVDRAALALEDLDDLVATAC